MAIESDSLLDGQVRILIHELVGLNRALRKDTQGSEESPTAVSETDTYSIVRLEVGQRFFRNTRIETTNLLDFEFVRFWVRPRNILARETKLIV